MTIDIFIRTYPKDYEWLHLALASIQKYVTGYRNIVICTPNPKGLEHLTAETVIQVPDLKDGYIGQQLTKLESWRYSNADFIMFWDSDLIALEPLNVNSDVYFNGNLPIIWKTLYSEIECPWQPITESSVKFSVDWEYMRKIPLVYHRESLHNLCKYLEDIHKSSLTDYLSKLPYRKFTEFNVIGAYVDVYEHDKYVFKDTATEVMTKNNPMQFWSWGGITNDVLNAIR